MTQADGVLKLQLTPNDVGAKLALIHSEVSEALEAVRDGELATYEIGPDGTRYDAPAGHKPEGLPVELADIVIRVADLAGAMGVDLEDAVIRKMQYNAGRPMRHGGKRL